MIRDHNPRNELGFSLCRVGASGQLVAGPVATGDPVSVSIPVSCPTGSHFEGLFHTHPGGVAQPSQQDIRAAKQSGAANLCIQSDWTLACFRIRPSRR